jgi:hypothetical protein
MLKDRAGAVGLPTERFSGHSLPAGHATTAAMAGVDLARIAAQPATRILTLVEPYIRLLEALEVTSSRDLSGSESYLWGLVTLPAACRDAGGRMGFARAARTSPSRRRPNRSGIAISVGRRWKTLLP